MTKWFGGTATGARQAVLLRYDLSRVFHPCLSFVNQPWAAASLGDSDSDAQSLCVELGDQSNPRDLATNGIQVLGSGRGR